MRVAGLLWITLEFCCLLTPAACLARDVASSDSVWHAGTGPVSALPRIAEDAGLARATPELDSAHALAEETPPITPAEAAKKVNEKVVVELEVKSTGGRSNYYLNSEKDYMDAKNFTIFISKDHLEKFKKAGVENPGEYYKEKVIRVTGTVVLENQKPWIKVTEPDQIKIVTKETK